VGIHYLVSLPLGSLLASAFLFHGDPRFRVPYDFCIFVGVAVAMDELRRRRWSPVEWSASQTDPLRLVGEP